MPLRDILTPNPRVLFVGINPSLRSEQVGHHFASPGNPFWKLLYASKLIPEPLTCDDDKRLVEFGMAMTNLCARASRSAAELTREEIVAGKGILAKKIQTHRSRGRRIRRAQHLSRFLRQGRESRRGREG